ncbi:MAG: DUF493 domain-containing protein [Zetaproteobacteria bacterium]|nr:MAG: DUF493 domain-containing protein [Zetaproteobacteria bacterium]
MAESASPLSFPCRFPVKVMGPNTAAFKAEIVAIARRHAPELAGRDIHSRTSANARYISITLTLTAQSQGQLDALYRELTRHPEVRFVL